MTRRYYSVEVMFYTTRPLRPIYARMPLINLLVPDAVEDELAAGRQWDRARVLCTANGVMELPQVVPIYTTVRDN